MIIEVWSDFSCPFCYIGKKKLEKAIKELKLEEKIQVAYKSYQLNPDAPDIAVNAVDAFVKLKGLPRMQVIDMFENVANLAKTVGLKYDMENTQYASTFSAHRLAKLAAKHEVDKTLVELLMDAYFVQSKNINDKEVLFSLGLKAGLSDKLIKDLLETNDFKDEVMLDINEAQQIGVQGVPFFVFNRKYAFSGAQPESVFKQTILKALGDSKLEIMNEDSLACEGDNCAI